MILKQVTNLRDIGGENVYNSGKYQASQLKPVELIVLNGHAWSADHHFLPIHICEGDVREGIREAIQGEPLAV